MTIFELASVTSSGRKTRLNAALHLKIHLKKRGKSERRRRSSVGCERVQALEDEKRTKMLGESDSQCGSYTTRGALHSQEIKAEKDFEGSLKRQAKAVKGVRKQTI